MDTPGNRWSYYHKLLFSSKRAVSLLVVVILFLAVPLTVFVVQLQQEIRQRAQEGSSVVETPISSVTYPWQYPRSGNRTLPVISTATKSLVATIPFSARNCPKKSIGDADCNNIVDLSDVSYWQIDYEKGTSSYADFNGDGKVTLTDYNIWREHANIAAIPLVQKLSQKLGLEKLLAATVWKVMSKNTFTAFAQEAIPTVSDSTLVLSADIYRIINQYTDQSYSVQTNETGNIGGQMTYYNQSGDQIAQVNNYNQDTATLTTRVGNNVVSVAQNPDGLVGQTIQDANGAFKAAQFWPTNTAYARGDFPQAVTLPIATGFTTVSLLPNRGAQVVSRTASGQITSYTTISGPDVATIDYVNNSYTVSNADSNYTYYVIPNNLGGETTYAFFNTTVVSTTVTDNQGNTTIIRPLPNGQYHLYITNEKKEKSEQDTADPMQTLGVNSLSPSAMTQTTQQYAKTKNSNTTSFTVGFATNRRMPVQISAVNRLLAIQNAQPTVLGAKTSLLAQSTVGTPEVPGTAIPAPETQTPSNTGPINTPDTSTPTSTPQPIPDNTFPNLHNPLPDAAGTPGIPSIYSPSTPQPAVETPTVPSSATLASGNTGSGLPADYRDIDAGSRETVPAQAAGRANGEPGDGSIPGAAPPEAAGRKDGSPGDGAEPEADRGQPASIAQGSVVSAPAEVPDGGPAAAAVAAAAQSAEVSESVAVSWNAIVNENGSTFTTNGAESITTNGVGSTSNPQGNITVEADQGHATSISIDGNTFTQGANGWEVTDRAEGAGEVNGNTYAALDATIQQQADITGVEQVGLSESTVADIDSSIASVSISGIDLSDQGAVSESQLDMSSYGTGYNAPPTSDAPATSDTPTAADAPSNADESGAATPNGGAEVSEDADSEQQSESVSTDVSSDPGSNDNGSNTY